MSPDEIESGNAAGVIAFAEKVFASHDKAAQWLNILDERLDGQTPFAVLGSANGCEAVESFLWQIDEGMYT